MNVVCVAVRWATSQITRECISIFPISVQCVCCHVLCARVIKNAHTMDIHAAAHVRSRSHPVYRTLSLTFHPLFCALS